MPNHLKVIISIGALLLTSAVFWFDTQAGVSGASRWIALGLGPLMVLAIWIFPEAKLREIRADAAQRREG